MMILKAVKINKYKSYIKEQTVKIEDKITTLVGKNESGKTAFLEALAKFNYFEEDENFKFNETSDYPRNELKKYQREGNPVEVLSCTFELTKELEEKISKELGKNILLFKEFSYGIKYNSGGLWTGVKVDEAKFLKDFLLKYTLSEESRVEIKAATTIKSFKQIAEKSENNEIKQVITDLTNKIISKAFEWESILEGYIAKNFLKPNLPKFWYFDEYFTLPSRININKLKSDEIDEGMDADSFKTSKALFELANIDMEELIQSENFESFIAELEATSNEITDQIFKYWSTNKNLEIQFEIETIKSKANPNINEKVLDIRVRNQKHRVSLSLKNRSKGFNWFFSFIVWFSKIQSGGNKNFILLLDEPGLNLHASAQADLLKYIEDLSEEYQIIYSTHSPFMIDSGYLERVRTVLDTNEGTIISDSIQEKDPDTLFPLQAALGYDIAQNLFISKNNLLVEGPGDLLFLTIMSNILESEKRQGLRDDFTIVPIGGMDKVSTFVSLLKGSKLNIVCLLDSYTDVKGKQKIDDLIRNKIIKDKNVRYFDEFVKTANSKADIEDMFEKKDYLKIFNEAFPEHGKIDLKSLDASIPNILQQLNKVIGTTHFNHYRPANKLAQMSVKSNFFSKDTLDRFENLFKEINKLI